MFVGLGFQPAFANDSQLSKNNTMNDEDKSPDSDYKDYWNCRIKAHKDGTDGKAFLFPGFFSSWPLGIDVKRAFGVLKNGCDIYSAFCEIYFNNDLYRMNWTKAYVFSFTGYFSNYYDGPWRIFEIDGTAKFVRVFL